jgi:hypothetical protein
MPRTLVPAVGGNRKVVEHNLYDFRALAQNTGNIWFVDSGMAASGTGLSPEDAVTTIDAAVNLCTASNGDVIFVMEGHAENLTAATSINADVAGITIWGLGHGNAIPVLTTTAAAGSITVGAANVTLKNLRMEAGFAGGTTAAITIAAAGDGCTLENIIMRDTVAGSEFLLHVTVATTVTDLTIRKCDFRGLVGESMTNSILFAGTSTWATIEDTYIHVDSSDDTVDHLAGAAVGFLMRRCVVVNEDTTTALYAVRQKSDGTGVHHDNRFAYNKVDAEISIGAACWWLENRASNTIAEGTILEPAATHAIP